MTCCLKVADNILNKFRIWNEGRVPLRSLLPV